MSLAIETMNVSEGMTLEQIAAQLIDADVTSQLDIDDKNIEIRRIRDEKLAAWASEIAAKNQRPSKIRVSPDVSEEEESEEEESEEEESEEEESEEEESEEEESEEEESEEEDEFDSDEVVNKESSEDNNEESDEDASFEVEHYYKGNRGMFRVNGETISEFELYSILDNVSGRALRNQQDVEWYMLIAGVGFACVFVSLFLSIIQFGLLKMSC